MPDLPPMTDPIESFADVVAVARRRAQLAREADPTDGGFDAPFVEMIGKADAWLLLVTVLAWVAVLVTVFITRGVPFLAVLGLAVAVTVVAKVRVGKNAKTMRRRRRESVLIPVGMVMCNNALFEPGDHDLPGVVVGSFDPATHEDADALAELAERIFDELKDGDPAVVPAEVREIAARLRSETPSWHREPLPESWSGMPGAWLSDIQFDHERLPRKCVDRRVFLVSAHPEETHDSIELLPLAFWWREDVDLWMHAMS